MNKRTVLAAVEAPLVPENETNPGKWQMEENPAKKKTAFSNQI